jgi:hypothetical protein
MKCFLCRKEMHLNWFKFDGMGKLVQVKYTCCCGNAPEYICNEIFAHQEIVDEIMHILHVCRHAYHNGRMT